MRVREIRKEKGLSVPALSRAAGVPIRTIENIERNDAAEVKTAKLLAKALGVSLDELCEDPVSE